LAIAAVTLPWWAPRVRAQRNRTYRIGFLGVSNPAAWSTRVEAMRAGLRDLG
jgi:hypothetical protein